MTCYLDLISSSEPTTLAKVDFGNVLHVRKDALVQHFPDKLQPHDAFCEFSIFYHDDAWTIRVDDTLDHVTVNGIPKRESRLKTGDILKSGQLHFRVRLFPKWANFAQYSHWLRRARGSGELADDANWLQMYVDHHQHQFALLVDAAADDDIAGYLADDTCNMVSLLQGRVARDLMFEAPYLCPVTPASSIATDYFRRGAEGHWGILLCVKTGDPKELLKLLRACLWTEMNSDRLFFRYYDPRVAKTWLPGLEPESLASLFGDAIYEIIIPLPGSITAIDPLGSTCHLDLDDFEHVEEALP